MDDMEEIEGGEDDGAIALDALKQIRSVLRASMSRLPEEHEEEIEGEPMEAAPEEIPLEEETIEEVAPVAAKTTVLSSMTPKYGGDAPMMPPMKAKKKGF